MENKLIRDFFFLIREGWMDGEQHGKTRTFPLFIFFGKMMVSVFGEYGNKHFTEEVDFLTTD